MGALTVISHAVLGFGSYRHRWMRVAVRAGLASVLVLASWFAVPAVYDFDDAYTALYNAQAFASGVSLAYDSPALSGSTSVPHVVAMSGVIRAGLSPLHASRLVAAVGFALFVSSIWFATRPLKTSHRVLVSVAGIAPFWLHATNGVETGVAFAVTLLALTVRQPLAVAGLCGFLPACRPDLALVAAAIWLVTAADASWAVRARMLAMALACLMPSALILYLDTGTWLPTTIAAKRYFLADACGHPLTYRVNEVLNGVSLFALIVGPLSLGVIGLLHSARGLAGLLAISVTMAGFVMALPQAVFTNQGRYLVPIVGPWLVYGVVMLLKQRSSTTWTVVLLSLTLVTLGRTPRRTGAGATELRAITTWVNEQTDPSDVLLIQDAGAISVFSERHLVDFVGIKSPQLIPLHQRVTWASCGARRSEVIAGAARTYGADYLVISDEWDRKLQISRGFRPGELTRVRSHAPGRGGYDVYRIERFDLR